MVEAIEMLRGRLEAAGATLVQLRRTMDHVQGQSDALRAALVEMERVSAGAVQNGEEDAGSGATGAESPASGDSGM